jgi:hypothetical protein
MGLEVTDYHGDGRHTVMNSAQVIPLRIGGEVDVIDHGTIVLLPPTPGRRTENPSAAEPDKARFENSSSAIAFPRDVGIDLKMAKSTPATFICLAYRVPAGVCQNRRSRIGQLISLTTSKPFLATYFKQVNHLYGILEHEEFMMRCNSSWTSVESDFEAVICGVIGLGSMFSNSNACKVE